jgi:hypothetical protein
VRISEVMAMLARIKEKEGDMYVFLEAEDNEDNRAIPVGDHLLVEFEGHPEEDIKILAHTYTGDSLRDKKLKVGLLLC